MPYWLVANEILSKEAMRVMSNNMCQGISGYSMVSATLSPFPCGHVCISITFIISKNLVLFQTMTMVFVRVIKD